MPFMVILLLQQTELMAAHRFNNGHNVGPTPELQYLLDLLRGDGHLSEKLNI